MARAAASLGRLVKAAPERRYTLHVAYPANKPDKAVAADGFRDFAGPDAVEDAAWAYMTKSRRVGLWHSPGSDGAGAAVESYIYRGPDWEITGPGGARQVVKAGDWLIGIVWEPDAWDLVKAGRITGVSMQGSATRRKPAPEALAALRKARGGADAVLKAALAEVVAEQVTAVRRQIADLLQRLTELEAGQGTGGAYQR